MSQFLSRYLKLGLREIVSVAYDWQEETSGFQEEHTVETVVARKGSEYVQVTARERKKFGPKSGSKIEVELPVTIGKEKYDELRSGKEPMDTAVD